MPFLIQRRSLDFFCAVVGTMGWAVAFLILLGMLAGGCSSSGGHESYRGPAYLRDPVMANIEAGARCQVPGISRPFDPRRDTILVESRPGTSFRDFWYGVDEWGRPVGGYLQLLKPWPIPAGYAGPFDLKCVFYGNPGTDPIDVDHGVILHEAGGHGNLVPSGVFDHPGQFRSCYPWWRLLATDGPIEGAVGPSVIYGPDGQVLHECGPFLPTDSDAAE